MLKTGRTPDLTLSPGEAVEVIMLPRNNTVKSYPLRGKPVVYTDPFEPAAQNDWDAQR